MKVTILINEGVALSDFMIPYDLLRDIEGVSVEIASLSKQSIPVKHLDLHIDGTRYIGDLDHTNILWVCGCYPNTLDTLGPIEEGLQLHLQALVGAATYVVSVADAGHLLAKIGVLKGVRLSAPRDLRKVIKKQGGILSKNTSDVDGKFISIANRGLNFELAFTMMALLEDGQTLDSLKSDWAYEPNSQYALDALPTKGLKARRAQKQLSHAFMENSRAADKRQQILSLANERGLIKGYYDITFYLYEGMRALDFAILTDILSFFPKTRIRCVSDKKGQVQVDGRGFAIGVNQAIHQVNRTQLLILCGDNRMPGEDIPHEYLTHWLEHICECTERMLTIGDGVRFLAVSGILTKYENYMTFSNQDEIGRFMIAETIHHGIGSVLKLCQQRYGDAITKAIYQYIVYGSLDGKMSTPVKGNSYDTSK